MFRERITAFLLLSVWLVCCSTLWRAPRLLRHAKYTSVAEKFVPKGERVDVKNANPQILMSREDSETLISTVGGVDVDVGAWVNDHNIVHVIHTRFLQDQQYKLEHLAKASYDMLSAFTIPSMQQQTNPQFLWIIWTDPDFRGPIAKQLIKTVKNMPNTLLMAVDQESSINRDFRSLHGISLYNLPDILLAGERKLLLDYYTASQSRLLVETRLDTGDAFSRHFVESIQSHAASTVARTFNQNRMEIFCPEDHMEWRYYQPGQQPQTIQQGHLVQYHNKEFCVHTGLSVAYNTQASARQLQALQGSDVINAYEECPKREIKPIKEECKQRGELVSKYDLSDLHNGVCPTGSFFCKGDNGMKTVFGGPRFALPSEFIECQVQDPSVSPRAEKESILVSVRASRFSTGANREQTGVEINMDGGKYMMAAVYVKGGPGGNLYKWNWQSGEGGVGGSTSGVFRTPNAYPIGHIDLCVIPTKTICGEDAIPQSPNATKIEAAAAEEEEETNECRRKLRMVFDEEEDDHSTDKNYIRNAVLLSQTPTDSSIKEVIPDKYRGSARHMVAQDAFEGQEAQAQAWRVLEHDFGISAERVFGLRRKLDQNLAGILRDAVQSPCFGASVSCHEGNMKKALEKLLLKVRQRNLVRGGKGNSAPDDLYPSSELKNYLDRTGGGVP